MRRHLFILGVICVLLTAIALTPQTALAEHGPESTPQPIQPPWITGQNPLVSLGDDSASEVNPSGIAESAPVSVESPDLVGLVPQAESPAAGELIQLAVPQRYQDPDDPTCGAAALGMALEFLSLSEGEEAPGTATMVQDLENRGLLYDTGTGVQELAYLARAYGYRGASPFAGWTLENLAGELAAGRPAVVSLGLNGEGQPGHFVTLIGMAADGSWIRYNDPVLGQQTVSADEFLAAWGSQGYSGLTVRKGTLVAASDPLLPWMGLLGAVSVLAVLAKSYPTDKAFQGILDGVQAILGAPNRQGLGGTLDSEPPHAAPDGYHWVQELTPVYPLVSVTKTRMVEILVEQQVLDENGAPVIEEIINYYITKYQQIRERYLTYRWVKKFRVIYVPGLGDMVEPYWVKDYYYAYRWKTVPYKVKKEYIIYKTEMVPSGDYRMESYSVLEPDTTQEPIGTQIEWKLEEDVPLFTDEDLLNSDWLVNGSCPPGVSEALWDSTEAGVRESILAWYETKYNEQPNILDLQTKLQDGIRKALANNQNQTSIPGLLSLIHIETGSRYVELLTDIKYGLHDDGKGNLTGGFGELIRNEEEYKREIDSLMEDLGLDPSLTYSIEEMAYVWAIRFLNIMKEQYEKKVRDTFASINLTQKQFDALVNWAYNVGQNIYTGTGKFIVQQIKEGNIARAAAFFTTKMENDEALQLRYLQLAVLLMGGPYDAGSELSDFATQEVIEYIFNHYLSENEEFIQEFRFRHLGENNIPGDLLRQMNP